jgi:hypothetical protein
MIKHLIVSSSVLRFTFHLLNDNLFFLKGNNMRLITKRSGIEIWAQFDQTAQVYELFFDNEGQTYTGWAVDSIKDALAASTYIIQEQLS